VDVSSIRSKSTSAKKRMMEQIRKKTPTPTKKQPPVSASTKHIIEIIKAIIGIQIGHLPIFFFSVFSGSHTSLTENKSQRGQMMLSAGSSVKLSLLYVLLTTKVSIDTC